MLVSFKPKTYLLLGFAYKVGVGLSEGLLHGGGHVSRSERLVVYNVGVQVSGGVDGGVGASVPVKHGEVRLRRLVLEKQNRQLAL